MGTLNPQSWLARETAPRDATRGAGPPRIAQAADGLAEYIRQLEQVALGVKTVDQHQGFAFRKHLFNEGIRTISATDAGLARALSAWLLEVSDGVPVPDVKASDEAPR